MLVKGFVNIHSSQNLSLEGRRAREQTKADNKEMLTGGGEGNDVINAPFTMGELMRALAKTNDSAPGKDEICYTMLRQLSKEGLKKLLALYNKVWLMGKVPEGWKEAIILPIRKPGRDPSNPGSYRPIALTSTVGKIMERMVNVRLTWYLEKHKWIATCQSGFRTGRGTLDPVLCLENEISKARVNKEMVAAVFMDIEKAYDMMWKDGLMIKMRRMGVNGRMFDWIRDFLEDRKIQVRVGKMMSGQFRTENGTPQGSVISPTLFLIMINDIFDKVPTELGRSLFADDGALWKRGRNKKHLVRKMQQGLKQVEDWGMKWGFRFSVEKSKVLVFTGKRQREQCELT
uniref:Reverse transcriptase domain-containing protein n=1 Tax=Oryzias melastigma TaxID=30732 RepID=A0A3B3CGC5_ORYME